MASSKFAIPIVACAIGLGCSSTAHVERPAPDTIDQPDTKVPEPAAQTSEPASDTHAPTRVSIGGVVRSADGAPVSGAMVAAIDPDEGKSVARATSGSNGRFHASVPPGVYRLTATAPGHVAGTLGPLAIDASSADRPIELSLGDNGFRLSGRVVADTGQPVADAAVRITRFSLIQRAVFYTRTDSRGRYDVQLPTDETYLIDLEHDRYTATGGASGMADATADLRAHVTADITRPAPDSVVQWIKQTAIPLTAVTAESGFDDMKPIASVIGDARVVALGEATHGTREFFQLKHRMLEYLVHELGFTVFAIEASFSESLAVNDYVLTGKGDPAKALAGLRFWTWDTEEVLALIRWMRRYNADPANRRKRKLKFYGFDIQVSPAAIELLVSYVNRVDRAYGDTLDAALAPFNTEQPYVAYNKLTDDQREALRAALSDVIARLDNNRRRYIRKAGKQAWTYARQHATILTQAESMYAHLSRAYHIRDQAMARNLQWILDTEPNGTRVVTWAHNGHVSRAGLFYGQVRSMGGHLHDALGSDQVIVGFAFGQGSFQAMNFTHGRGKPGGVSEHTVGPAPPGSIGATFARTGLPMFLLDMRGATGPAARWLRTPHPMRAIGAAFESEPKMANNITLTDEFDAIIFVDKTTRARPTPTGVRPPPSANAE